jgi:hypothetical protein
LIILHKIILSPLLYGREDCIIKDNKSGIIAAEIKFKRRNTAYIDLHCKAIQGTKTYWTNKRPNMHSRKFRKPEKN